MYATSRELYKQPIDMTIQNRIVGSSYDPDVFGPPFWFTLHNGSTVYPIQPTEFVREEMKRLITALPLIVPCLNCREHFFYFVRESNLDVVTKSRENLFNFFVEIHNYVNRKLGKPCFSLDDAKKFYGYDKQNSGAFVQITYK